MATPERAHHPRPPPLEQGFGADADTGEVYLPPDAANPIQDGLPGTTLSTQTADLGKLYDSLTYVLKDRIILRGRYLSEVSYRLRSPDADTLMSLVVRARRELGLAGEPFLKYQFFFGFILARGSDESNFVYSYRFPSNNSSFRKKYFTFFPGQLYHLRSEIEYKSVEDRLSENVTDESKQIIFDIPVVVIRFLHRPRV